MHFVTGSSHSLMAVLVSHVMLVEHPVPPTLMPARINALSLAPLPMTLLASYLHPLSPQNIILKYADDTYLLVPSSNRADERLFSAVVSNENHVLHSRLPVKRPKIYDLRPRAHDYSLPPKDEQNFITRLLYKNIYR